MIGARHGRFGRHTRACMSSGQHRRIYETSDRDTGYETSDMGNVIRSGPGHQSHGVLSPASGQLLARVAVPSPLGTCQFLKKQEQVMRNQRGFEARRRLLARIRFKMECMEPPGVTLVVSPGGGHQKPPKAELYDPRQTRPNRSSEERALPYRL